MSNKHQPAFDEVATLAREMSLEWFRKHGGEDVRLMLSSARVDLELHLLEATERLDARKAGLEAPNRWQVAPGVASKCRDQIIKLTAKMDELKDGMSEVFREVCENYGYSATGKLLETRDSETESLVVAGGDPEIELGEKLETAETTEMKETAPAVQAVA